MAAGDSSRAADARARPQRNASARVVLHSLLAHGALGRKKLAAHTGLSTTTITSVVNDLMDSGALIESSEPAKTQRRGRPEVPLSINLAGRPIVATYIRPFETVCGVYDLTGRQVSQSITPHPPRRSAAEVVPTAIELTRTVLGDLDAAPVGVGLSTSGHIDRDRGLVVDNPFGWSCVPLRDMFEEALGRPVILDSSWRASALGQVWSRGDWESAVLTVFVGRIIGGALIDQGAVYRGGGIGVAGSLDHFPAVADGPRCPCGSTRCLGTVGSLLTAMDEATRRGLLPPGAPVSDLDGPGAGLAELRMERACMLGLSLRPLIEFMDPTRVVLLGRIGDQEEIEALLDCAAGGPDTARRPTLTHELHVTAAGWAHGAASLVLSDYLARPMDYESYLGSRPARPRSEPH